MGRTVLQRYVMVTEVGVPDILTRISYGFRQFLLANPVEICMNCAPLIATQYIQLKY